MDKITVEIKGDTSHLLESIAEAKRAVEGLDAQNPLLLILKEMRAIRRLLTAPLYTIPTMIEDDGDLRTMVKHRHDVASGEFERKLLGSSPTSAETE